MSEPDDLMAHWRPMPPSGGSYPVVLMTEAAYEQAIAAAVVAEREECAQICEAMATELGLASVEQDAEGNDVMAMMLSGEANELIEAGMRIRARAASTTDPEPRA